MGNRFVKWLLIGSLSFAVIVMTAMAAAFFWYRNTVASSQPQTNGSITVVGIREPVEIIRDIHGVPHIFARNEPDLFFAMGYAMAQDRLWQLDLHRRIGAGRLSEILGQEAIEVDRYFRTLSAARKNRPLPPNLAFMVDSFAAGINAYIAGRNDRLPLEFKLLGYRPEPWTPQDYFSVYTLINWGLSIGWKVDLTAAEVLRKVEEEMFREAFPAATETDLPIVSEIMQTLPNVFSAAQSMVAAVEEQTGYTSGPASNNWVISGNRTVTGKPLLANDTHMALTNPPLWWEVHLVCPTIDATGFAIPGLPGLPVGRNRDVAWGVTNVMADDVDFYIEQLNPQDPSQYRYTDRWEDMRIQVERIRVKGAEPVDFEVRLTRHGPIIAGTESDTEIPKDKVVSARWAVFEFDVPARAAYLLLKAGDAAGVVAALQYWNAPGQNFVFADTHGTIGYRCSAAIPVRPRGNGLLPLPGWTGTDEWAGFIAFDKLPHTTDPQAGYIASANNPVTGGRYPHVIGTYWEPRDRISRIRQMIDAKPRLSIDDMKSIQTDVNSPLAAELTAAMLRVMEEKPDSFPQHQMRDILKQWDFKMTRDSSAAAMVETTYLNLLANIFQDELGADLYNRYIGMTIFAPRALRRILKSGQSAWLDDIGTPEIEALADVIEKSMHQAFAYLRERMGSEVEKWTWGHLHTLTFRHVLAERKPLQRLFDLGPYRTSGSHLTVNKKQYDYTAPFAVKEGVSQRMIVDLSSPETALHVLPTGQSGLLGNPHYKDQVNLYLDGLYHPSWLNRSDIDRHTEAKLVLMPR
jgi:penicillin amidase